MQRQLVRPIFLRRIAPLISAIAILTGGTVTPAQARQADDPNLPQAETLLDKHVEATGGKQAHLELHWRKRTGRLAVDMAGHKFEANIEQQFLAPDKSHALVDGSFFSQVTVCDGENAWEWRPGHSDGGGAAGMDSGVTVLLEGAQKTRAIEQAQFHAAVRWRDRFASVQTLGVVEVNGAPAYEVQLKTKSGEQYTEFYDKAGGRLVKRVRTTPSRGEQLEMEVFLSDYREFDGVWLATKIHANLNSPSMGNGTQIWTYTDIEHKEEISAGLFVMPDELRKEVHPKSSDVGSTR
jgi:hypothetical protein